jgi:hypothetical protein
MTKGKATEVVLPVIKNRKDVCFQKRIIQTNAEYYLK